MHRHRFSPAKPRSGFALLITITLLAFLVLLLVSLASLTRVETQVASNNQQLSQARQNALMAMNLALGRLQQLAGPDQRITGTAELVSGVHDSKRRWTGVWNPVGVAANAKPVPTWLVSTPTLAEGLSEAVVKTAMPTTSVVTLVGAGSTDVTNTSNIVSVQTQPITSNNVAGFPDPQIVGNFAYWVGDEGVKAKVSLRDPWTNPSANTLTGTGVNTATAKLYRTLGVQRAGIEGVSATGANAATTDKLGPDYPAEDATFKKVLPQVLSLPQFALANSASPAALTTASKSRFHDLTSTSFSVMSNTATGGLKKDLTAWLAKPASATNLPLDSTLIADPAPAAASFLPKWGLIRSYAETTSASPITPRAQSDTVQGVYPVITYSRLGFNVSNEGDGTPYVFHFFPVVVLWNPFNTPIAATNDLEFRFEYADTATVKIAKSGAAWNVAPLRGDAINTPLSTVYMGRASTNPAQSLRPFKFRLNSPVIPPGQSLVYTLSADQKPYDPAATGSTYVLTPVGDGQLTKQDYSVTMTGDVRANGSLPLNKIWFYNTSAQMEVSLVRQSDEQVFQVFHQLGSYTGFSGGLVFFPINLESSALMFVPLLYNRMFVLQSQGSYLGYSRMPRWLAQLNPRSANVIRKAPESLQTGESNLSHGLEGQGFSDPNDIKPTLPTRRASIGPGEDVSSPYLAPPGDLVLQEFQPDKVPLFSLAQLQHAGLSLISLYPAYAVGNSLAHLYVPRDQTKGGVLNPSGVPPTSDLKQLHDLSYILNQALWDKYFFSTIPTTLTDPSQLTADYHLPNSRHTFHWPQTPTSASDAAFVEMKTTDGAAAHLLINGGFNVNSTSVQAWRALLYSHNEVATDPANAQFKHPFSRYTVSPVATSSNTTPWQGSRILSNAQLDNLAAKIVDEVKTRGPFLSLADFVNRRLQNDATGLKGALQAAIDAVDSDPAPEAVKPAAERINSRPPFTDEADNIWLDASKNNPASVVYNAIATYTIKPHWVGADPVNAAAVKNPASSRAAFAPGFLTQADVLSSIGPVLTARSDTFVIRSYGDVQNPAASNAVEARAWCEAVVQRLPEYVEPGVNPTVIPASGSQSAIFGRRFKIISFRWLTANDV